MTTVKEPPAGPKLASFLKSVISQLKPQRRSEAPANKPSEKPSGPASSGVLSDEPERRTSLDASASRCQFTYADGRHCKTPPMQLCTHHAEQKHGAKRIPDASALEALCTDLTTATNINRALGQTFLLMAQGRISRKDAVAFGYLSQLMLQTVPGIRAEYVSAFGYDPWEEKLTASLTQDSDDDPHPSSGGDSGVSRGENENLEHAATGVIAQQKGPSISSPLPHEEHEEDKRRTSQTPSGSNTVLENQVSDPSSPDFADLYRRGCNLVQGKYDTTPEGRCEMNKLTLELELMKPAPDKPARDFIGRVAHLQRTIDAGLDRNSSPPSMPPALDYYGNPIKTYATPPPWESGTATPGCAPPGVSTLSSAPCSAGHGETAAGDPALRPLNREFVRSPQTLGPYSFGSPEDFVPPPSQRHRKSGSHSASVGPEPHTEWSSPISGINAMPDSAGGPDADHHEGHLTGWYAPPSWSKIKSPGPFPSRQEKLQRNLRGMSHSAFRHLQHRNSRGF